MRSADGARAGRDAGALIAARRIRSRSPTAGRRSATSGPGRLVPRASCTAACPPHCARRSAPATRAPAREQRDRKRRRRQPELGRRDPLDLLGRHHAHRTGGVHVLHGQRHFAATGTGSASPPSRVHPPRRCAPTRHASRRVRSPRGRRVRAQLHYPLRFERHALALLGQRASDHHRGEIADAREGRAAPRSARFTGGATTPASRSRARPAAAALRQRGRSCASAPRQQDHRRDRDPLGNASSAPRARASAPSQSARSLFAR